MCQFIWQITYDLKIKTIDPRHTYACILHMPIVHISINWMQCVSAHRMRIQSEIFKIHWHHFQQQSVKETDSENGEELICDMRSMTERRLYLKHRSGKREINEWKQRNERWNTKCNYRPLSVNWLHESVAGNICMFKLNYIDSWIGAHIHNGIQWMAKILKLPITMFSSHRRRCQNIKMHFNRDVITN